MCFCCDLSDIVCYVFLYEAEILAGFAPALATLDVTVPPPAAAHAPGAVGTMEAMQRYIGQVATP